MENLNPFTPIIQKLESIETMLLEIKAGNSKVSYQEKEVLPPTGGISLAVTVTGLKKSTIYKMTSTGEIPFSKPSGKLIFVSKDLLKWVEEHSKYK